MSASVVFGNGLRPSLNISTFKNRPLIEDTLPPGGTLSPDVKPPGYTPEFSVSTEADTAVVPSVETIGKYLLLDKVHSTGACETFKALHIGTREEFICKTYPLNKYREQLAPHWQSGFHPHIADIVEILLGTTKAYVIFRRSYEDLHSYIRKKRRLRETEATELFRQIVSAIKHCHKNGIVLRDLKLRKFIFVDKERSHLVLDGLEDAFLLEDIDNDRLTDKHGCPAYVSPEILSSQGYSGKSADMWSLGVILYTMLFGQYPFHDTVASQLFGKIRRGHYVVPDSVSAPARCLVRSLLRTEPSERLTVEETCRHPWFTQAHKSRSHAGTMSALSSTASTKPVLGIDAEQRVPEIAQAPSPMNDFNL
jgi:tribbles homolog 1/2